MREMNSSELETEVFLALFGGSEFTPISGSEANKAPESAQAIKTSRGLCSPHPVRNAFRHRDSQASLSPPLFNCAPRPALQRLGASVPVKTASHHPSLASADSSALCLALLTTSSFTSQKVQCSDPLPLK